MPHAAVSLLVAALLFAPVAAPAQQNAANSQTAPPKATLQVTQGPYYTGVPIDLHIVAEGFEEDPTPDVGGEGPAGATLNFVQARPQVSSMMQIINGKVSQSRTVRFAFVYQLTASTAGSYTLGPFTISQDGKSAVTRAVTLKVGDVPEASGQRIRVLLPDKPIFVGQRVPVKIEWWTEVGLADRLYNERLHVPLFLDATSFQFFDAEREPSRITINVDMPGGTVEIPAAVKQVAEGGRQWVIRSFERTLVPVATGRFDLGRPSLFCEEAVSFQRDIFGSRVPSQTRRLRVSGDPIVFDVNTVPVAGRPPSFAGAIGQGFTIDVAADRTVMQIGDPVKLTFTIRGDGSMDSASLPPLSATGLSPTRFRLPDGEVAGRSDDSGKHFDVTVRVIDPTVREIPPIEYSWFDPSSGKFETTRTQPIALSVRAANVVGAGDVVSAAPAEQKPEAEDQKAATGTAPRAPVYTLTGADLSVDTDVARLRSSAPSPLASPLVMWGSYGAGLLAIGAGLLLRRQRSIDPVKARLHKELSSLRAKVARERSAKQVADSLRRMAAFVTVDARARPADLDGVLAQLDESAYAPGGAEAAIPDGLRSRALAVADAMLEGSR